MKPPVHCLPMLLCAGTLVARPVAHAYDPPIGLAASLGSRGGAVYARGVEVLSEIGAFEIFKTGAGPRATLLAGPSVPERDRGTLSTSFAMAGTSEPDGVRYEYELRWVGPSTLRIRVTYRSSKRWPTGAEFCIGKLSGGLFAGSFVTSGADRSQLPKAPRPIADRILLTNRSSLSISSSIIDVMIAPIEGDISVADFRSVPWDARRSFYLYSSRRMVLPQQTASFSFDLIFSPPRLDVSVQFGQATLPPTPPITVDGSTFFVMDTRRADVPVRGVLTELLPPARKDVGLFKGYVRAIARARGNTLVMYHTPEHVLALQRGSCPDGWWTREELIEIAEYARARGIEVIPGMTTKFSARHFPHLSRGEDGGFYDAFDPKSYEELFGLYQTLLGIYRPKALLIGHDEIHALGRTRPNGWSDARILAADVEKVSAWLRARGVRTLMFGDMLLDRNRWPKPLIANSNNPRLAATDVHEAIDLLPRDIIILDWQYYEAEDYPTIAYFKSKGFAVWGVSWYEARAAASLARSVVRHKADGILASDWGLWRTLSPAATSLYAVKGGGDSAVQVRGDGEDAVFALAGEMRGVAPGASWSMAMPIDLRGMANGLTRDGFLADGRAFVELGGAFDLRALPAGRGTFAGVPFRVLPIDETTRANCVIATAPGHATVTMRGAIAKALAFLQTMRQRQPQVVLRPVGEYEIVYTDGHRRHIPLIENYNITDVRAGPGIRANPWEFSGNADVLIGSYLGWRGPSLSGMPMNLQVMLWDNPDATIGIDRIELKPNEGVTLVLVALSARPQESR